MSKADKLDLAEQPVPPLRDRRTHDCGAGGYLAPMRALVNLLLLPVRLVGALLESIGNVFRGSRA